MTLALTVTAPAQTPESPKRLRCRFSDQDFTYALVNTPTTRDLISLLPLALTIEDFSTNEKIAHLPRRLDKGGLVDFDDERPLLLYHLGQPCLFPSRLHFSPRPDPPWPERRIRRPLAGARHAPPHS